MEDFKSADIEPMRLKILSKVNMMNRLTDERYFEDVIKTIKAKDYEKFLEICKMVGIHKEMAHNLWKILMARDTTYADTWL